MKYPTRHATGAAVIAWAMLLPALPAANAAEPEAAPESAPAFEPEPLPAPALTPEAGPTPTPPSCRTEQWWECFGDAELSALVQDALSANPEIAAARHRVTQSDATARGSLAPLLPSVSLDGSINVAPYDSLGFQFGGMTTGGTAETGVTPAPPDVYYTGSANLKVGLKLDLFGRSYLGYTASRRDADASRADRDASATNLIARLTQTWFDTASAQAQLEIIEQQEEANTQLLEIVEMRFENGSATALDVLQQRQQVDAARARVPQARLLVTTGRHQLAVLTGRSYAADLPLPASSLPPLHARLSASVGLPSDLALRRPDLRAAAARHEASADRASSAMRGLFPRLTVSGQVGYQANQIMAFQDQWTWGVGAALSIPLFEGGLNWASWGQAEAAEAAAEQSYRQALLLAEQQAGAALARESELELQLSARQQGEKSAALAFGEARIRYVAGLDSYVQVLTSLASLQAAQLNRLQTHRDLIINRIDLYNALGGTWTQDLGGAS